MCVITVKLHIVNTSVGVDYILAGMLFWDLQEGQERFYDFDGVTDGYCKFIYPLGPWAVVFLKMKITHTLKSEQHSWYVRYTRFIFTTYMPQLTNYIQKIKYGFLL